jgi:hypothetical protein
VKIDAGSMAYSKSVPAVIEVSAIAAAWQGIMLGFLPAFTAGEDGGSCIKRSCVSEKIA